MWKETLSILHSTSSVIFILISSFILDISFLVVLTLDCIIFTILLVWFLILMVFRSTAKTLFLLVLLATSFTRTFICFTCLILWLILSSISSGFWYLTTSSSTCPGTCTSTFFLLVLKSTLSTSRLLIFCSTRCTTSSFLSF